jgi:alkanesulfonate monooxygenase SsuD/methylene tetrahydromethanopterin reductase-like flavin-dependent oxidoreductase (luciferase family)
MIFEVQLADPSRQSERDTYASTVEQAVLADQLGFDGVWAVEHHNLRYYAHCTSPEVLLSYIAAKTERIRIGHGVVMLPKNYNHPIRVAERVATLDILSNGRVDVGTGVSSSELEMGAFGVDPATRHAQWEEAIRIIPRMWRDEPFEHHGTYFDIPPRNILPKPVQVPHPPLYVAATRNETLETAARLGIGALCMGFGGAQDVADKRALYDQAIAARDPAGIAGEIPTDHLAALCPSIVLANREQAVEIGVRAQRFFVDALEHAYAGGPEPRPQNDVRGTVVSYISEQKIESPSQLQAATGPRAYGTPDDAAEYVEALRDAGADEVMFLIQMGPVAHETCMETIRLLGQEVIPHFRRVPVG